MDMMETIKAGESETTEFKTSLADWRDVVESISAFSNKNGGTIFIGVGDNCEIIGTDIGNKTIENLANQIKQNIDPVIYPSIHVENVDEKKIIVVDVAEYEQKPVFAFAIAFVRVGKSNQKLGSEGIRNLAINASKVYWDERICENADIEDIDEEKVKWFLDERKRTRNVAKPEDMGFEELLINTGAVKSFNGDMKPTNAGILFFGKNPHRFFVNSGLRIAKFKGIDITHPVIDRIDCRGTLWEIVNMAEEFIRRNIRLLSFRVPTSFQRDDKFEYPIDALREAIINALIHRSYPEPADVRIFLFDTHVEIINPGTFPEGVTPKHPIHKPVNPILSSFMYDIGFIEKYGSGIKLMRMLCKKWGNREPFYDLHPLETKIVFESRIKETTYIEVADISDKLNERQKKGLYSAQKNGFITRKEYMDINFISNKTAYNDLKDMAEKGFVNIAGKGRGVRYVIQGND